MASKRKSKKHDHTRLQYLEESDVPHELTLARTVLTPTVQAGFTLLQFEKGLGNSDLTWLVQVLSEQTEAAREGDLSRAETMLTAQAHTLDAIFNNLARCAINAERMDNLDCYFKLALRAQSQCRATWETLAIIKNPPMMGYVKQANIAQGHQQVNNEAAPRVRETENSQSKLLEETDGERLDTGAAGTAGGIDSTLEAVGAVHGTKDRRG